MAVAKRPSCVVLIHLAVQRAFPRRMSERPVLRRRVFFGFEEEGPVGSAPARADSELRAAEGGESPVAAAAGEGGLGGRAATTRPLPPALSGMESERPPDRARQGAARLWGLGADAVGMAGASSGERAGGIDPGFPPASALAPSDASPLGMGDPGGALAHWLGGGAHRPGAQPPGPGAAHP